MEEKCLNIYGLISRIPSASKGDISKLSAGWHLPPLARQSGDGVDMMPFILYDKVVFDQLSFVFTWCKAFSGKLETKSSKSSNPRKISGR